MAETRREGPIGEAMKMARQVRRMTLSYVEDLETEALLWRPAVDALAPSGAARSKGNPILWLLWHVGEVEESVVWTLDGKPPIFRFGRSALSARGDDETLPGSEDVIEYLEEVRERYRARLEAMPDEDLDKAFGAGVWEGKGRGLIVLPPRHETYHCGQIAYIRRLMGKPLADVNERNPYR